MRQVSPSRGGTVRPSPLASQSRLAQGSAISAVQPRSRSVLSLTVPSTLTPVIRPGKSHLKEPSLGPRGCVVNPTPFHGLKPSATHENTNNKPKPPRAYE